MSSAREVIQIDSLPQHLNDSLRTGPGTCPNTAGKLASKAPLQTASQWGHLPGPRRGPAELSAPGKALSPRHGGGSRGKWPAPGAGGGRGRGQKRQDAPGTFPEHGDLTARHSAAFVVQRANWRSERAGARLVQGRTATGRTGRTLGRGLPPAGPGPSPCLRPTKCLIASRSGSSQLRHWEGHRHHPPTHPKSSPLQPTRPPPVHSPHTRPTTPPTSQGGGGHN